MTIYSRGYYVAPVHQEEMTADPARVRRAVWEGTTGPVRWLRDIVELDTAKRYDEAYRLYNAEGAREWAKQRGLEGELQFEDGRNWNELELGILARRKKAELRRASVISRAQGQTMETLGISLAASFMDPLNVAAGFVPVVGQARYAQMLARAGGPLGRGAVRAGVGAVEGTVGMAAIEPLNYAARYQEQADYTAANALYNVGFGALFGLTLHAGGGAIADTFARRAGRDLYLPEVTDDGVRIRSAPSVDQPLPAPGAVGMANQVRVGERYVPVRWAVMDAEKIAPTIDKAENQYRDRNREAAQAQVRAIAANLDFQQLGHSPLMDYGAPTLAPDGRVIGGNGRLAAIRLAYNTGRGDAYRMPLLDQARQFGISPEEIKAMARPVLVRILNEEVDVAKAAILSNEGGGLRMSALEQAKVDSERLGDMRAFEIAEDGSLAVGKSHNAIRRWINEHPATSRGALLNADGQMSAEGVQRLRNALLFRAYGDSPTLSRLIEAVDPGSRNIAAALMRVAARIGELRDGIKAGERHNLDLSDDLQAAVEKIGQIRESGQSVDEALRQGGLFGADLTPEAAAIVRFMGANIRSSRALAEFLNRYLDGVERAGNPKQADMLGATVPTKLELLERAATDYVPTAQEQLELVPTEVRIAAGKAAIAQGFQGQAINVEPIVQQDLAGIVAAAKAADDPDTKPLNDPSAARAADEELADMPDGDQAELAAAEKDMAEAELARADAIEELTDAGVILPPDGEMVISKGRKAGDGIGYTVLHEGEDVGRISGFDETGVGKGFHIFKTGIRDEAAHLRGTGLYQRAVQQVADQYENGAYVNEWEASPALRKALAKMPTYEKVGDRLRIRPTSEMNKPAFDYTPNERLAPDDVAIEKRFADWIAADPERAIAEYGKLKDAMGGKFLSADVARELSPDYIANRSKSLAVHEPASALVKIMYARRLAEKPGKGEQPVVLFSAGGTGAGKTSGFMLMPDKLEAAHIVYDTNMDGVSSAARKFEQAIKAGHKVQVLFTYNDPMTALRAALGRSMAQFKRFGTGRTVPIDVHLSTHIGSNQAVRDLSARYGESDQVSFFFTNNSFGRGEAKRIEGRALPKLTWEAYDDLRGQAVEIVESELAQGRITQEVATGFLDSAPPEPRAGGPGRRNGEAAERSVPEGDDAGSPLSDEQLALLPEDLRAETQAALDFSNDADEVAEIARRAVLCSRRTG